MRSSPRLAARIAAVVATALIGVQICGVQAQPTSKQPAPAPNKAQTPAQKRMAPPPVPVGPDANRLVVLTEKVNQKTNAVISGNTKHTYI